MPTGKDIVLGEALDLTTAEQTFMQQRFVIVAGNVGSSAPVSTSRWVRAGTKTIVKR